jgi:GTP-binding protein EngB required for normal cell division
VGVGVHRKSLNWADDSSKLQILGGVMSEPEPDHKAERHPGELNDPQQKHLRITCQYIDKLLSDIEGALHAAASKSPFPRYVVDITPAQSRVIEDHIHRLRSQLLRTLAWQHMKPNPPDIPATGAVMTNLSFVDIAIEELKPGYMKGYGAVAEDAVSELNGVVYELRSLVEAMERHVRMEFGGNLEARLRNLEQTGCDVDLLRLIEQIVTRQGVVELRSRIDSIASRLEDNNLEVALFGRVSSGKSSLLNALLDTDVLPVGANPITAVPTKLRYGPALCAAVAYGDGRGEIVAIEELSKLITEQGNPGNSKNIVRAMVEVPSLRLRHGIVLVDTPGLGPLAKRGGAETLAYLPACDLVLALIDAGATLNDEDIGTLRLLYEAGIPAIVLLSKADLLAEEDLHQAANYIQEQLQRELGLELNVHPASSLSGHSVLLDQFFARELLPRFEQARSLRNTSIARKIGALRDSVVAALETNLDQKKRGGRALPSDAENMEARLRQVNGMIGEQRATLNFAFLKLGETPEAVLSQVADTALLWMQTHSETHVTSLQVSELIHDAVQRQLEQSIGNVGRVSQRAIDILQSVAHEMGRADIPTPEEFEVLLRDMPRIQMAAMPEDLNMSHWTFLGDTVVRAKIRSNLRNSIGELLQQELYMYGRALSQWNQQFAGKMEFLTQSYADAYRVQLQRMDGADKNAIDSPQLEQDLAHLKKWEAEETSSDSHNMNRRA